MNKQIANLLGLCQRAGKLLTGDALVKNTIKKDKALLVLLATDASERTKKEFYRMAQVNEITVYEIGTKVDFGWAVGKSQRAAVVVTDENFSRGIIELIERGEA
ncbi:MAG: 50S ribosomal protein L7 [Firmicutes bacterium]|nr:50S ribosomal protein L7 [Bacillota bacterium]